MTFSSSGIGDGVAERADLIERLREGDQAITRDAAISWLQPDNAAQRRRLADGAAGIGAQRGTAHSRRQRRGRSTGAIRRERGEYPMGCASS